MKRTNIYLSEKHIKNIKQIKKETGAPSSEIIRRALEKYFKDEERKNEKENYSRLSKISGKT